MTTDDCAAERDSWCRPALKSLNARQEDRQDVSRTWGRAADRGVEAPTWVSIWRLGEHAQRGMMPMEWVIHVDAPWLRNPSLKRTLRQSGARPRR
jgi:hypothetical protein